MSERASERSERASPSALRLRPLCVRSPSPIFLPTKENQSFSQSSGAPLRSVGHIAGNLLPRARAPSSLSSVFCSVPSLSASKFPQRRAESQLSPSAAAKRGTTEPPPRRRFHSLSLSLPPSVFCWINSSRESSSSSSLRRKEGAAAAFLIVRPIFTCSGSSPPQAAASLSTCIQYLHKWKRQSSRSVLVNSNNATSLMRFSATGWNLTFLTMNSPAGSLAPLGNGGSYLLKRFPCPVDFPILYTPSS